MTEVPVKSANQLTEDAAAAAMRTLALRDVAAHPAGYEGSLQMLPSVAEQSQLGGQTEFTYVKQTEPAFKVHPGPKPEQETLSEAEGLQRLRSFLEDFVQTASTSSYKGDRELAAQANDILHNSTYISEHVLKEAATAMAATWKRQLDDDPAKSIYLWSIPHKSSTYVLDKVLGHFDQSDIEKYRGRLHFLYGATGEVWKNGEWTTVGLPPNGEVVMCDDWIDTGRQFSREHEKISHLVKDKPDAVSLYLVTASHELIQNGAYANGSPENIPVHAQYVSRLAADGKPIHTGTHSSTDDRFEESIGRMVASLRENHGQAVVMPPLTNIDRQYRQPNYVPANIERVAQAYGERYTP